MTLANSSPHPAWPCPAASAALAGIVDPDCTAEKAAKSAAAKATVGVGGRCSAGEAAKDSGKGRRRRGQGAAREEGQG